MDSRKRRASRSPEGSTSISARSNTFQGDVKNFQSKNTIVTYYGQYPELRQFLSPLDSDSRHSTILDKLTKGTGDWLLCSERFKRWKNCEGSQVLCLLGEPGIGKSSLYCHVIQNLYSGEKVYRAVVSSIYCDYLDKQRQTARNLIGALLSQLVVHLGPESDIVKELEDRRKHNRFLTTEECMHFMRNAGASGHFGVAWLCFDALDELDIQERDRLLRAISTVCGDPVFRIFLTGRSNAGVDTSINRLVCGSSPPISAEYFSIPPEESSKNIRRFLEQRLEEDSYPSLMDEELRERIFKRLANESSTFLLAALNIGKVLEGENIDERDETLTNLALNLEEDYREMVERLKSQGKSYGIKILQWILFAQRPLTLKELRYAVAIEPGITDFNPRRRLPSPSIIDSALGLVTVDQGNHRVRFVHFTFREHLLQRSCQYFPRGHALLAEANLTYLSLNAMGTEDGRRRYADVQDLYTFYLYAAENWGHHVRQQEDEAMVRTVCHFLGSDKFLSIRLLNRIYNAWWFVRRWCASPLHAVAYFGLSATMKRLLSSRQRMHNLPNENGFLEPFTIVLDVNSTGEDDRTPLIVALDEGYLKIAKILLDRKDINPGLVTRGGRTPLLVAASNGHDEIARLLLKRQDIDVNFRDRNGWTPLQHAISRGHTGIAKCLLERGDLKMDLTDGDGRMPLFIALHWNCNIEIVKLLLGRMDLNVNSVDKMGQTPLQVALFKGHNKFAKQLLKRRDVIVNLVGREGWTPLTHAIDKGHTDIVKILIGRENIDVNLVQKNGPSPLFLALQRGQVETARLLLEKEDIDVNLANKTGWTPLFVAINTSHVDIVARLLEQEGINVNCVDVYGQTPLMFAVERGRLEIVKLLLAQEDIDVNVANKAGLTPLLIGVETGQINIVTHLLEKKGVDVNFADIAGQTPLTLATKRGRVEIVKLLLAQKDINVNLPDRMGHIPLPLTVKLPGNDVIKHPRSPEVIDCSKRTRSTPPVLVARPEPSIPVHPFQEDIDLIFPNRPRSGPPRTPSNPPRPESSSSEVTSIYGFCQTPLFLASAIGNLEIVELLLERDEIDVNFRDESSWKTPLFVAIEKGYLQIAKRPLGRKDVDVNLAQEDGRAPLSLAVERGQVEVSKLLLSKEDTDPNLANKNDRTARVFLPAAKTGHFDIVIQLLEKEGINVNCVDGYGRTPLFLAVESGQIKTIKLLLRRADVDVNLANKDGWTPLFVAINTGHVDIVARLLKHEGINENCVDVYGQTPLMFAVERGRLEIVELLLAQEDIDVNMASKAGLTPLLIGVETGQINIVMHLLEKEGINVNFVNMHGQTPLKLALQHLSRKDINVNLPGRMDRIPFHLAARPPKVDSTKRLTIPDSIGINTNSIHLRLLRSTYKLPAFLVSAQRYLAIVEQLLKRDDIDVNFQDEFTSTTPLFVAVENGLEAAKRLLSRKDTDVNLAHKDGRTPLHVAIEKGSISMVAILLEHEATNVHLADAHGRTPLQSARENGQREIAELLERKISKIDSGDTVVE